MIKHLRGLLSIFGIIQLSLMLCMCIGQSQSNEYSQEAFKISSDQHQISYSIEQKQSIDSVLKITFKNEQSIQSHEFFHCFFVSYYKNEQFPQIITSQISGSVFNDLENCLLMQDSQIVYLPIQSSQNELFIYQEYYDLYSKEKVNNQNQLSQAFILVEYILQTNSCLSLCGGGQCNQSYFSASEEKQSNIKCTQCNQGRGGNICSQEILPLQGNLKIQIYFTISKQCYLKGVITDLERQELDSHQIFFNNVASFDLLDIIFALIPLIDLIFCFFVSSEIYQRNQRKWKNNFINYYLQLNSNRFKGCELNIYLSYFIQENPYSDTQNLPSFVEAQHFGPLFYHEEQLIEQALVPKNWTFTIGIYNLDHEEKQAWMFVLDEEAHEEYEPELEQGGLSVWIVGILAIFGFFLFGSMFCLGLALAQKQLRDEVEKTVEKKQLTVEVIDKYLLKYSYKHIMKAVKKRKQEVFAILSNDPSNENQIEKKIEEKCKSILGNGECGICLCDFQLQDLCRITICDHVFHVGCIDSWACKNQNCPYCRTELSEEILKKWKERTKNGNYYPLEETLGSVATEPIEKIDKMTPQINDFQDEEDQQSDIIEKQNKDKDEILSKDENENSGRGSKEVEEEIGINNIYFESLSLQALKGNITDELVEKKMKSKVEIMSHEKSQNNLQKKGRYSSQQIPLENTTENQQFQGQTIALKNQIDSLASNKELRIPLGLTTTDRVIDGISPINHILQSYKGNDSTPETGKSKNHEEGKKKNKSQFRNYLEFQERKDSYQSEKSSKRRKKSNENEQFHIKKQSELQFLGKLEEDFLTSPKNINKESIIINSQLNQFNYIKELHKNQTTSNEIYLQSESGESKKSESLTLDQNEQNSHQGKN